MFKVKSSFNKNRGYVELDLIPGFIARLTARRNRYDNKSFHFH